MGAFALWGQPVDQGLQRSDSVPQIEPLWHLWAASQSALSLHHSGRQWPQGASSPTPATAHPIPRISSVVLVPADAQIASQPGCDWSVLQFLGPGGYLLGRAWPRPCALPGVGSPHPWTHAQGQLEATKATSGAPVCRCETGHRRPLQRFCY